MLPIVLAVALAASIAIWLALAFNQLVRANNLVREAWSEIDVQLKRRADLIPNLVATVRGYLQHERGLLESVTELRGRSLAAATPRERGAAESALSRSLGTLVATAEAYPDLKANQSFLELQRELSEIEEQLQLARRYYDGAVREYNILAESFPSNLAATAFGFRPAEYFEIEAPAERAVPAVAF
jgi:LemA protein